MSLRGHGAHHALVHGARLGSARLGSARLGSDRHGSDRLGEDTPQKMLQTIITQGILGSCREEPEFHIHSPAAPSPLR